MERLIEQLERYTPWNEQEERDRALMLEQLKHGVTPLCRENEIVHFTASAWIVNPARTKVLMIYHNIYQSWAWTGGHADGEADLLAVALREAREESGIEHIRPVTDDVFSIETLHVAGHEKRGRYVPCHLHMNLTYLLEADENDALAVKPDENSGVAWIPMDDMEHRVSEQWMIERIYRKLNAKLSQVQ